MNQSEYGQLEVSKTPKTILVTGAAGFIGYHLCQRLLARGDHVVGIDNLNDYYEVSLKESRLSYLNKDKNFSFDKVDLADRPLIEKIFSSYRFDVVVNLAAQAGVRYSLVNPYAYIDANIVGFINILEGCRHHHVKHLVYASSSSVYGANTTMPFSVHDNLDHPVSLYAASKNANELMGCQPPVYAFLQCMALGDGLIWHCFFSRKQYCLISQLMCSTMGV